MYIMCLNQIAFSELFFLILILTLATTFIIKTKKSNLPIALIINKLKRVKKNHSFMNFLMNSP